MSEDQGVASHTAGNVVVALIALCAIGSWHAAVVLTSGSVGVVDVAGSIDVLIGGAGRGTWALFGAFLAAVAAAGAGVIWLLRKRRSSGDAERRGLASKEQAEAALGETAVRESAAQTRPGLSAAIREKVELDEIGLRVGRDKASGSELVLPHDDHLVVMASTGGGKSTLVMIPAALAAPGALVVTSNEVSILDLIATSRARLGRLWVFDPLNRASWPEPMVWNAVGGCEDGKTALARGIAFAAGLKSDKGGSTNAGFFQHNAMIALSRMLHAAALSGRDMSEVLRWTANLDIEGKVAARLISESADPRAEQGWADMLVAVSTGAVETVSSSRQTLQQAVEPLTLKAVTRWVSPQPGVPEFDAGEFVRSTDTLVLISDDSSATNVGPLCTMLFQEVMDAVKAAAPTMKYGKLDPPLRVVGDEFANIAPIDKAPELASEVRKLGVQLILAFQSELQTRSRWGDRGQILLEQCAELALAGLKSPTSLRRYSELTGKVDVDDDTHRQREVLRSDELRMLESGTGLLLYRNAAPMVIELDPWFRSPNAEQLEADRATVADRRAAHARAQGLIRPNHLIDVEGTKA
ncbi:type IV secretory system conjugative DNA transfer family protein [Nocardioides sp. GXZ039]|uniref:type IV secretory system conjugative DNA transfer family protein n=1 Tax=Nocardioides sp. GXZ039 TaxID=3136018 RepID=UPI0030F3972A